MNKISISHLFSSKLLKSYALILGGTFCMAVAYVYFIASEILGKGFESLDEKVSND